MNVHNAIISIVEKLHKSLHKCVDQSESNLPDQITKNLTQSENFYKPLDE